MSTATLIRAAGADARRAGVELVAFVVGFKLVEAWVLVPAAAGALAAVMAQGGHVAVTDWDIVAFLGTPAGAVYAALFGVVAAGLLLVEQAGVLVLLARSDPNGPTHGPLGPRAVVGSLGRVVRLGAVQLGLLAIAAVPFAGALGLVYLGLLAGQDINYYLAERPPAFWSALGIGGIALLAAAAVGVMLAVRWTLALPILLYEGTSVRAALRTSGVRVRGLGWWVAGVLLGWHGVVLLGAATLEFAFRWAAHLLPEAAGENPWVLAGLLIGRGAVLAGISAVAVGGHAVLVRRFYELGRPALDERAEPRSPEPEARTGAGRHWTRAVIYAAVGALVAGPVATWVGVAAVVDAGPGVQVTAHRGHAKAAPENTLSAIRAAIASGADYAEVDVQLTADGVPVLVHDRDLKRVTGDPRRVEDVPFVEVRALDAGGWFGPGFAGEQIPTLAEAIALARGRIKLNLELKLYGPDRGLAREVARVVAAEGFEGECVVTSFSRPALAEVRVRNPRVRTGPIVAAALGDVAQLDGDLVSVRADLLTDRAVRQAHGLGREVHAWTVNDERQMVRLMARGVDNILTSDPDVLIRVRARWSTATDAERLALASRVLLGLE